MDYSYFSLRKRGHSVGASLYSIPEIGYTRATFNLTVERAAASGEPYSTKTCSVTPWLRDWKRGAPFRNPTQHGLAVSRSLLQYLLLESVPFALVEYGSGLGIIRHYCLDDRCTAV